MKKGLLMTFAWSCACIVQAQDDVFSTQTLRQPSAAVVDARPKVYDNQTAYDTLALPRLDWRGRTLRYPYTGFWGGWSDWKLHPGLNGSLSASATVGLGDDSFSGFSQSVALMYAASLSPRLSLGVGGYFTHFNWGPRDYNDAGLTAVLGYRFDEHWEAYLFAEKSLQTPHMPRPLYDLSGIGDKIGAEVRYNFSPSLSVGLSVWRQSVSEDRPVPFNRPISDGGY